MNIFKTQECELPLQGQEMAKGRWRGGSKQKARKSLGHKKLRLPSKDSRLYLVGERELFKGLLKRRYKRMKLVYSRKTKQE